MQRLLTGLLGVSLLLAACGDDDADADRAAVTSIPDDTTTSSTTTAKPQTVAVDVIPQDTALITEDYVEQVLNQLFEVSNRALVKTMEAGVVDESVIALVEATSPSHAVPEDLNRLAELAADGFPGVRAEPTPVRAKVRRLIVATPSCVFAEVTLDRFGTVDSPAPSDPNVRSFARLVPATEAQRSTGLNPTAWLIDELPATSDGSTVEPACNR